MSTPKPIAPCPHCGAIIGRQRHHCRTLTKPRPGPVPKPSDFAALVARARAANQPQPQQLTLPEATP